MPAVITIGTRHQIHPQGDPLHRPPQTSREGHLHRPPQTSREGHLHRPLPISQGGHQHHPQPVSQKDLLFRHSHLHQIVLPLNQPGQVHPDRPDPGVVAEGVKSWMHFLHKVQRCLKSESWYHLFFT